MIIGAAAIATGAARAAQGTLRLMRLRHASFVIELGGVRVLIDPTFSRDLGLGPFLNAPPPARLPDQLGQVDLVLVTSGRVDHFDPRGLERLSGHRPHCLVPSEAVAKRVRHRGHRRVRVVRAGDRVSVRGVEVVVAPAKDLLAGAASCGYRIERAGRSLWHTGPLPPIDLFGDAAEFARTHPTEVLLATADGTQVGASFRVSMGRDDARLLGEVARARFVVPQQDGFVPSGLGHLLLRRAEAGDAAVRTELTPIQDGRWVRVARRGGGA